MILSSVELLYLAAYLILVYEYVVMRHKVICSESDARIVLRFDVEIDCCETFKKWVDAKISEELYWNRGTK